MSKKSKRGRLKIYLGMAAGVGKTYAMLKDALEDLHNNVDIVAGYIEPHGRLETEELAKPLESIPIREVSHEGLILKEFNLQAALERKPHTILVDELAHTNAPGSLHQKRWLDIQTLLDEGINVWSTLNIQHLESIAELVSSLCEIQVHETVPDSVLREADVIEVIDIPPEELIERLKEGKIYKGEKIDAALRNFFKEGNLLALREVLLRKAAEKIDSDVLKFRESLAVKDSWATSDRMIVALGPNRFAKRLVQKASRIASSRKLPLTVVYVQTPHLGSLAPSAQKQLDEALQLAHLLGATLERKSGTDIVGEILRTAIALNASLILVGKPIKNRWRDVVFGSLADDLIRRSGNIDVLLVTGEEDEKTNRPVLPKYTRPRGTTLLFSLLAVLVCTVVGLLLETYVGVSTIALLYVLGGVVIARIAGRTESIITAVASVLCFNFFFIEPKFTFTVQNPEYLATFFVMLVVSLSISGLVTRIKLQNVIVEEREKRALALYEAGRAINAAPSEMEILKAAKEAIMRLGDLDCGILILKDRSLASGVSSTSFFEMDGQEFAVAKFVADKRVAAGNLSDILPGASALYLPIQTEREIYGVCGIQSIHEKIDRELLPTFELIMQQTALCLERLELEAESVKSNVRVETEAMRSLVLSSVSHDFRTPLTVIEGASEQILISANSTETVTELSSLILEHSKRLSRMVNNALSYARLEQGNPKLNLEWESLEELIGQALEKYRAQLQKRTVTVSYPEDLPLLHIDAILIDQVLSNVIENSLFHASGAKKLELSVEAGIEQVSISISDDGPGPNEKEEDAILRSDTNQRAGSGLGLKICELIAKIHGGSFLIGDAPSGGTQCILTLPVNRGVRLGQR